VTALQGDVERYLQVLARDNSEFAQGIAITSEPKKSELLAARKAEQDRYDLALAAAEKSGLKWPPLIPRSEKSLIKLKQLLPGEKARIETLPVQKMRESVEQVDKARDAIEAKDYDTAE